jgi:hypothetical protein
MGETMKTRIAILTLLLISAAGAQTPTADAVKALAMFEARVGAGVSYVDFPAVMGQVDAALLLLDNPAVADQVARFKAKEKAVSVAWYTKIEGRVELAHQSGDTRVSASLFKMSDGIPGADEAIRRAGPSVLTGSPQILADTLISLMLADAARQAHELRTALTARKP